MPCRFGSSPPVPRPLAIAIALALGSSACAGEPETAAPESTLQVITVTGASEARSSASASKLDLSIRETPQSVSVVTRERMDDFKLDNANQVLANTTGVTVELVETERTYYTARGFDIINFQYDSVGLPLVFGNSQGDLDTALYERIDIVRGANGLSASTGNPSATINFIRKRPTAGTHASAALTLGSWNKRRIEADVATSLNAAGTVRGRAVAAVQDGDSYLDRYGAKKKLAYAVVDAALGANTLFTIGHVFQQNQTRGGMWGALPLYYTDGSPTNYPVGTSTSADWSHWDTLTRSSFTELTHELTSGWNLKATLTRNVASSDSRLFYVYGTPDKATGAGLFSYPSAYDSRNTQTLADIGATGKFRLGGREHDLSLGVNWSRSRLSDLSQYGRGIGTPLTSATDFTGAYPQPLFDASIDGSSYEDKRKSAYLAARFSLGERTKLLTGLNATSLDSSGTSYGTSKRRAASETTPYVGLVYEVAPNVSTYASYTEIFNPQSETDLAGNTLAPIMGNSAEAGFKAELYERKLLLTGAVFRARQNNTAEQAGMVGTRSWYRGIDAQSKGVELEASGEPLKGLNLSAGLTHLKVEDSAGKAARTFVPRNLLRLSTTWRVPAMPQLKVGANLNWQSKTERDQGEGIVTRQDAYAVLGLMARYEISDKVALALNLNNVTDKKYLTSLYWSQAYYAAPRNASATLSWAY